MSQLNELNAHFGRQFIFELDDRLRRWQGIEAFSHDPNCVLRISRGSSSKERLLADGTPVHAGDPTLELHWWNERIASVGMGGSSLRWGLQFYRHAYHSLLELAQFLDRTPELRDIVAVHGETTFASDQDFRHHARAFRRLGLELEMLPPARDAREFVILSFRHFHVWLLTWACNPTSLRHRAPWVAVRSDVWISRQALLDSYINAESPLGCATSAHRHRAASPPRALPGAERERIQAPPPAGSVPGTVAAEPWSLLRASLRSHSSSGRR